MWQDYVGSLQKEKETYQLQNLYLKTTKNDHYLNTAKLEKFTLKETQPFVQQLFQVDTDVSAITSNKWKTRIMGIQQASKEVTCVLWAKQVIPLVGQC